MLTKSVHLVPLQGHVTGTCLLMMIVILIPQSVSQFQFTPSLSAQGVAGEDRERVAPEGVLQEAREFGVAVGDVPAPNRLFYCLDLYHTSLNSGEYQYKSRI